MTTNVVVYANCQGVALSKYLRFYPGHGDLKITCLENYKFTAGILNLDDYVHAVTEADKFLFHPLTEKWGRLSTATGEDNILAMLKPGCERLSFPYIYNDALWPLIEENGTYTRNHEALDVYLAAGAECGDLIKLYNDGELDFRFATRMNGTLEYLRFMERETDVTISPYVAENVLEQQLFTTSNHPTNAVFAQIVPEIARFVFGTDLPPSANLPGLDNYFADLPGYLPIDEYCIEDLGIRFKDAPDDWAADHYRALISNYCSGLERQKRALAEVCA